MENFEFIYKVKHLVKSPFFDCEEIIYCKCLQKDFE